MIAPAPRDAPAPPTVFHVAETANLRGIARDGLWPARNLARRALGAVEGERLSRTHRPRRLELPDGVVLRDQAPMPPQALARALDPPVAPADWYGIVNLGVYFWVDRTGWPAIWRRSADPFRLSSPSTPPRSCATSPRRPS